MTSAFSKMSPKKCLEILFCVLWAYLNRRLKRDFLIEICPWSIHFFHIHLLIQTEILKKNAKPLVNFSQIWNKVCLGKLNSSEFKIMKRRALLQRLSLTITCNQRIWSFVHPFRMRSDWTVTDSEYLDESLPCHWSCADCYKQCNNHFGVNVSTLSSLLLFKC